MSPGTLSFARVPRRAPRCERKKKQIAARILVPADAYFVGASPSPPPTLCTRGCTVFVRLPRASSVRIRGTPRRKTPRPHPPCPPFRLMAKADSMERMRVRARSRMLAYVLCRPRGSACESEVSRRAVSERIAAGRRDRARGRLLRGGYIKAHALGQARALGAVPQRAHRPASLQTPCRSSRTSTCSTRPPSSRSRSTSSSASCSRPTRSSWTSSARAASTCASRRAAPRESRRLSFFFFWRRALRGGGLR